MPAFRDNNLGRNHFLLTLKIQIQYEYHNRRKNVNCGEFAPAEHHTTLSRYRVSSILMSVSFTLPPHHPWTKRPTAAQRKLPALVENETLVIQAVSELFICIN
jgi:hypothetical protein